MAKIKVINKSKHFIYFVTQEEKNENWHFNIALQKEYNFLKPKDFKNAVSRKFERKKNIRRKYRKGRNIYISEKKNRRLHWNNTSKNRK